MSSDRFQRLKDLFKAAIDLDPPERAAILDEACRGDQALRARIERMLDADGREDGFLETPAVSGPPPEGSWARLVGARIGSYTLTRILSSGGMGIVYEALQDRPRRTVAVKVMRQGFRSKTALRRFEHEAQILARLEHPGIARVIETGTSGGGEISMGGDPSRPIPYIVMEYIPEARTIAASASEMNLKIRERLGLFLEACDAVHHGHRKGIIHRDLKPGNILVDASGRVKVIDFGVARILEADPSLTAVQTEAGELIGTLQYMSPEQCEADPLEIDIRSDVYSLGVVLYEMLCGLPPYDVHKTTLFKAARIIREKPPERPSTIDQALKGDLETILLKALEKDRDRRYQAASDLAADIRRYLGGEVIHARPATPWLKLWKRVKRNPVVSAASAVALMSFAAFLFATPWYLDRLAGERDRARAAGEDALKGAKEAREQERLADARYEEIIRLSDTKRLKALAEEADALWPARPDKAQAMEDWLARAGGLLGHLEAHRRSLDQLRGEALTLEEGAQLEEREGIPERRSWIFEDYRRQWRHDILQDLVEGLEEFRSGKEGTVQSVRDRLAFAKTVYERTVERHREAWSRTIAALADPDLCPRYGGLRLRTQVGVIPLGRNPESGLFEFAHLQTGEAPERGPDGGLRLTEESGIVFILLPGGTFDMGAVPPSEGHTLGSPNVDTGAMPPEGPVHAVTVKPFLISKYEMTQGQWVRFTGRNPSSIPAGDYMDGKTTLLHPVEHVSWEDGVEVLRRLGLRLPTEAEWEYAARGGTSSVWWTGNDERSLGGESPGSIAGNLHDLTAKRQMYVADRGFVEWFDDGYSRHAPVGSFRPNPFGFHDVCGNVWEFCQDAGHGSYDGAPADGSAWEEAGSRVRIIRGGGFDITAMQCRSAFRAGCLKDYRASAYGIRPALSLEK